MPKTSAWKSIITETLKQDSLNYIDLFDQAKELYLTKFGPVGPRPNKKFDENLMNLIKEDKIQIIGYDSSIIGNKRIQSFKKEGIIFYSVKTNLNYIRLLMRELDDSNEEIYCSAYKKLRKLFFNKINEYLEDYERRWDRLLNKIKVEKFNDNLIIQQIIEIELDERMPGYLPDPDLMENLIEEYKIKNPTELDDFRIKNKDFELWTLGDYSLKVKKTEDMTKEKFLNNLGFIKPPKMNISEKDDLFQKTMTYSKLIKGNSMIEGRLILGLSQIKDSMEWFKEIIEDVNNELKLSNISLYNKVYGYDLRK